MIKTNPGAIALFVQFVRTSENAPSHPNSGAHQISGLRPPEQAGLGSLQKKLWCGSSEV